MYRLLIAMSLLAGVMPASAQVGFEISLPNVSIGINLPIYPELVLLPGSPVYYAPRADSNYFFYDGLYWVYKDDQWYSSDWYNGPWQQVSPQYVPLFILRVPVRYYRRPPAYFHGWRSDAPPRWGQHWGDDWTEQHRGWDQWRRGDVPRAAPLPTYQREYSGRRYPTAPEKQQAIRSEHDRHQPREAAPQQQFGRPPPDARPQPEPPRPPMTREPRQAPAERPQATRPPEHDASPVAPQALPKPQTPARQQESRPSAAEQDRQHPPPSMQRPPENHPENRREPDRGRDRNEGRDPDRRQ